MKRLRIQRFIISILVVSMVFLSLSNVLADDGKGSVNPYCCDMYVVSSPGSFSSSSTGNHGHAFIIVYNISTSPLVVGHMSVPAGGSVTVGIFGNRPAHAGVWYNIEGNHQISGISLSTALTASDLATVNSVINSGDYYNAITHNCAHFAASVWNSITASAYHISGITPTALYNSINSKAGASASFPLPTKTPSDVAYQAATGVIYDPSGV